MKCKSCDGDIDFELVRGKRIKIKKGNPSFYFICPICGAKNHVKCRHKSGKKRTVKISQQLHKLS